MLTATVPVNIGGSDVIPPIVTAIREMKISVEKDLLKDGADIKDYRDGETGDNLLMLACKAKMPSLALEIIKKDGEQASHVNNSNETALISSIGNNLSDVIEALILGGKSLPGQVTSYGSTALTTACRRGMSRIAIMLIETGESNPGYVDYGDQTALLYATEKPNLMSDVALKLISTGESNPTFWFGNRP